jgi:hypothetical protein
VFLKIIIGIMLMANAILDVKHPIPIRVLIGILTLEQVPVILVVI